MAKVVLDMDGTIYSTAKRMVDLVKIHYPSAYKGGSFKDIKEHGFKPVLDISEIQIQDMFNRKDFYIPEYIMPGCLEFIEKYKSMGHEIEILTVGTPYNNANKALLLEESLGLTIKMTSINIIGEGKISMDKSTYTAEAYKGLKIYVDDRIECLDTVRGFDYKIQFCEDGYVLDIDDKNDYAIVEDWDELDVTADILISSVKKVI